MWVGMLGASLFNDNFRTVLDSIAIKFGRLVIAIQLARTYMTLIFIEIGTNIETSQSLIYGELTIVTIKY